MKGLDELPRFAVAPVYRIPAASVRSMVLCAVVVIAQVAAAAGLAEGPATRSQLFHQLLKAGVLDKDRLLVHLSRVCTLTIDRKQYPVLDVMELVPGAQVPRGVNRVVVTDSAGHPVKLIGYVNERPLFCIGPRLYVHGDLAVDGVGPEGNVLLFSQGGSVVSAEKTDVNAFPLQPSGVRSTAPE